MEEFITAHKSELLSSLITFVLVLILKFGFTKAVRKVGKLGDFNQVRTNLIIKYISIALTMTSLAVLTLIWGVNFKDLGVLISSVFAVIGIAFFAQWSILSNVTAGVIIFFSYPFKIGNTIRIFDKEINDTPEPVKDIFVIEDIRAFHLHLRRNNGEMVTYPNSLILQKGVALISSFDDNSIDDNLQAEDATD
ncbi:mechanosensitive ion channel domain-containing protein [Costertonia aggregata]|uniref:Mechanosensitive ion channel n=1 Tax=Costertonia aggregata TaxID=343403 RepID=A0A7H9ATH1_9FLAO|nr:mechanosensitive ion channel domain-containing protein [Costertonia aggregata]QLG46754.1 mechanosensitive ion channel [Costertonia aggregata]